MGPFVFVGTKDYATGLLDITSLGYANAGGWNVGSFVSVYTITHAEFNYMGGLTAGADPFAVVPGLRIVGSGGSALIIDAWNGNPTVIYRMSNGSPGAPTQAVLGDILGVTGWRGWETTDYGPNRARMLVTAADSFALRPATRFGFFTSSGGGLVQRFGIGALGEITVGVFSFQIADALDGKLFLRGRTVASLPYGVQAGALLFCQSMTTGTGPGSLCVSGGTVNKPTYFDGNSWFVM